jgi:hypothetical protein
MLTVITQYQNEVICEIYIWLILYKAVRGWTEGDIQKEARYLSEFLQTISDERLEAQDIHAPVYTVKRRNPIEPISCVKKQFTWEPVLHQRDICIFKVLSFSP